MVLVLVYEALHTLAFSAAFTTIAGDSSTLQSPEFLKRDRSHAISIASALHKIHTYPSYTEASRHRHCPETRAYLCMVNLIGILRLLNLGPLLAQNSNHQIHYGNAIGKSEDQTNHITSYLNSCICTWY